MKPEALPRRNFDGYSVADHSLKRGLTGDRGYGHSPSVIAFTVILVLYITAGVLAAIGTAYVSKALLPPKFEQVFYAVYLAMIAGFYLAFTMYFGSEQAWRVESTAVLCFALIGLAGIRMPFALIAGYLLHGLWDVIHELHAHAGLSVFEPGHTTAIPLAYGAFCASYDSCMAGYFFTRRAHWNAAWTGAKVAVRPDH